MAFSSSSKNGLAMLKEASPSIVRSIRARGCHSLPPESPPPKSPSPFVRILNGFAAFCTRHTTSVDPMVWAWIDRFAGVSTLCTTFIGVTFLRSKQKETEANHYQALYVIMRQGIQRYNDNKDLNEKIGNLERGIGHLTERLEQFPPVLILHSLHSAALVPILVKMRNRNYFSLMIDPRESVDSIKKAIYDREGIPEQNQILYFYGVKLQGTQSLAEYGVQRDSIIHLYLDLNGSGAGTSISAAEGIDSRSAAVNASKASTDKCFDGFVKDSAANKNQEIV